MKKLQITSDMTYEHVNSIFKTNFGFEIFREKDLSRTLCSKKRYVKGTPHTIEISGEMKVSQLCFEFNTHISIEGVVLPDVPRSCRLDEVTRYLNHKEVYGTSEFIFHDISLGEELVDLGLQGLTCWNIPINNGIIWEITDDDILETYSDYSGVHYLSLEYESLLHRRMKRRSKIIPKLYTSGGDSITGMTNEILKYKYLHRLKPRITIWMTDIPEVTEPMSVKLPIGISPTEVKYHFVWVKYGRSFILLDIEVTSQDGLTKYYMNIRSSSMDYSDEMVITILDGNLNQLTGSVWGEGMTDSLREMIYS
jgi:hypothetical protein